MADLKVTVTPVLSSSAGYVADIGEQVSSLLRFIIMNPAGTSSLWEEDLISFRNIASKNEGNRTALINAFREAINRTLQRAFPTIDFTLNIKTHDYDNPKTNGLEARYTISFEVFYRPMRDPVKRSAFVSGKISVDKTTNEIDIKFTNDGEIIDAE